MGKIAFFWFMMFYDLFMKSLCFFYGAVYDFFRFQFAFLIVFDCVSAFEIC